MPLGIIIAIIIAAGAGVSYSAQNDLPGDALYDVKTKINEPVSDAVSLSAETQAETDSEIAVRRVEEAEELAVRGALSAELSAQLEANFQERVDAFETHMAKLEARGENDAAAKAASDFEAALRAHERVLVQLEGRSEHLLSILERVRANIDTVAEARADAEAKVQTELGASVEAAARGRLNAVKNKIAEVEGFLSRMESKISAEAMADAEAELQDAIGLQAQGEAELNEENWAQAFLLFQQAVRTAQNAKLMVDLGSSLNIVIDAQDMDNDEGEDSERNDNEREEGQENEGEDNAEIRSENSIRIDLGL